MRKPWATPWCQKVGASDPALPLRSCVLLAESPNFSGPLQNKGVGGPVDLRRGCFPLLGKYAYLALFFPIHKQLEWKHPFGFLYPWWLRG